MMGRILVRLRITLAIAICNRRPDILRLRRIGLRSSGRIMGLKRAPEVSEGQPRPQGLSGATRASPVPVWPTPKILSALAVDCALTATGSKYLLPPEASGGVERAWGGLHSFPGPSNSGEARKKKTPPSVRVPAGLSDDDAESPLADERGPIEASPMARLLKVSSVIFSQRHEKAPPERGSSRGTGGLH